MPHTAKVEISFDLTPQEIERLKCKQKSRQKRKRIVLSIKQKVDIIKALDNGKTPAELCKKYFVGLSTVYDLKSRKNKILKYFKNERGGPDMTKRKLLREPKNSAVDSNLYDWYRESCDKGIAVSGPMLVKQAKLIHKELGIVENCRYSTGWLMRFKARHGIQIRGRRSETVDTKAGITIEFDEEPHDSEEAEKPESDMDTTENRIEALGSSDSDFNVSQDITPEQQPCDQEGCGSTSPSSQESPDKHAEKDPEELVSPSLCPSTPYGFNIFDLFTTLPPVPNLKPPDKDGDDTFFTYLASEMKRLPNIKKAHLKLKIMNMLVEALKDEPEKDE